MASLWLLALRIDRHKPRALHAEGVIVALATEILSGLAQHDSLFDVIIGDW
jgi:hypothetical protein